MHYTPAQTRWFLAAIDRAERDATAGAAIAARMAQADAPALNAWLAGMAKRSTP